MREKSKKLIGIFLVAGFCFSLLPVDNVYSKDVINNQTENVKPLVYIESGPVQKAINALDGSEIDMPTDILWTVRYNKYPANYSQEDFEQFIRSRRGLQNQKEYRIIDNSGSSADSRALNIVFVVDSSVPSAAETALGEVELYLESLFDDPITVRIYVEFASLPSGVLGSTGVYYTASPPSWSTTRNSLINGMDDDDFIQDYLPSGSTIPVRYDGGSSSITNENRCYFAWANYGAIGYYISGNSAETAFNSSVNWDYDPSNGVPSFRYCFQSVAVHEFGHALGFVSRAEYWYEPNSDIYALDIYRFQYTDGSGDYNPDTYAEFQTAPRLVDYNIPNDLHNSNLFISDGTDIEYRMSDGDPWQASHFRTTVAALMQPAFGGGESFYPNFFRSPDINMLDAIGWDYWIDPDYQYVPGDANMANGLWPPQIIGADATFLVNYFRGTASACLLDGFFCSADVNGDCQVIGSDVTRLVNYFRGTAVLDYCADYPPAWLTPDDCPVDAPSGWPNCD